MTLNITQELLERLLPFMGAASEDVFAQLQADMAMVEGELVENLEIPVDRLSDDRLRGYCEHWAVYESMLRKLRSRDLILTDSGFGIVSTSNVAPASRERVDALEKELEWRRDDALERIITLCRDEEWADTTAAMTYIPTLLWRPIDLKHYAHSATVNKRNGRVERATFGHIQACASSINAVMTRFEHHFSVELAEELLFEERAGKTRTRGRQRVVILLRQMMGQTIEGLADMSDLTFHRIGGTIERHIEEFPEYRESDEYIVNHADKNENSLHSKAYFF